jgi:hypothetical protein
MDKMEGAVRFREQNQNGQNCNSFGLPWLARQWASKSSFSFTGTSHGIQSLIGET